MLRYIEIIIAGVVLGALLTVDVVLRVRNWRYNAEVRNFTSQLSIVDVRTNGTHALVIADRSSGQPIWGRWNFGTTGTPDCVTYFWQGKDLMNIYPRDGTPPRFALTFYGTDGTVRAVWGNRGTNYGFTERTIYEGGIGTKQVWFNERWYSLQYRTNADGQIQGGAIIDGNWKHLTFTNGGSIAIVP